MGERDGVESVFRHLSIQNLDAIVRYKHQYSTLIAELQNLTKTFYLLSSFASAGDGKHIICTRTCCNLRLQYLITLYHNMTPANPLTSSFSPELIFRPFYRATAGVRSAIDGVVDSIDYHRACSLQK